MRIPAVIFTYAKDALPVRECVRGAFRAGLIPVVVDDSNHPLPRHVAEALRNEGVMYKQSSFPRNGNLRGAAAIRGICTEMISACAFYRTDFAIKLDSDTIILNASGFSGNRGICSYQHARRAAYGCAYSLDVPTAAWVRHHFESSTDPDIPEDLGIWEAVAQSGRAFHMDAFHPERGPLTAIPEFAFDLAQLHRFEVVTCGNTPTHGWHDRGRQIAIAMSQINRAKLPTPSLQ